MRNRFERQLLELNNELIQMGSMIERAALVCRIGHQNRHLGNIRRMISDPLHIGNHL